MILIPSEGPPLPWPIFLPLQLQQEVNKPLSEPEHAYMIHLRLLWPKFTWRRPEKGRRKPESEARSFPFEGAPHSHGDFCVA